MGRDYVILVLMMGLVTYLTRAPFLVFSKKIKMPDLAARSLKYFPVAILSALIFPVILVPEGRLDLTMANPYILSGVITGGIVLVSKNSIAGILSGLVSLAVLRQFL